MQAKFLLNAIVLSALGISVIAQENGGVTTTTTTSFSFSTYATYTPPVPTTSSRTPRQSLFQAEGSASYFNALITQADFSSVRSVLLTVCPTPIQDYWTRDFPNIISAYALVTPAPDWISEGLDAPGQEFIQSVGVAERQFVAAAFEASAPTGMSKGIVAMAVGVAAGMVGIAMM
ncbi:MAG: hypothetical protein Q9187_006352 [Circinaria calcarea]